MNQFINRSTRSSRTASQERLAAPSWTKWLGQVARGNAHLDHVATALKLSLATNVVIVLTMTAVAVASKSLALLSTLVENMVDLVVQTLLAYAGTHSGKKQDYAKFPAGTSRLEPVAVIVASSTMMIVSVVFIQEGVKKLVDGFVHDNPEKPRLTVEALVISGSTIAFKIFLTLYCRWILRSHVSPAVEAIHDDNRNDVASNSFAITAYIIASVHEELWYVDPVGAIVIFLLIMIAWGRMGKEQIMQLVGVTATDEFIQALKELCGHHNAMLSLDVVRAYHFGTKYLVELEVIVPEDMTVKDAHDIALQLQFKVEQLEDVERAFVHVDYKAREYDEHIVSREEDALLTYAGYSGGETPRSSWAGNSLGMEIVVTPTGAAKDSNALYEEIKSTQ